MEEKGMNPSVATDENRIMFRGNLYICKLTIVINSHEGRRVFRHFVPRDYTVKKVVVDHHKNFGLDRMVMVYSVRPWKAAEDSGIRESRALPENTFSQLINELGYGCDKLFHLKVTNTPSSFFLIQMANPSFSSGYQRRRRL